MYCPVRKKGISPNRKAGNLWQGPGEVVNWLSEVAYRVHMPGQGRVVVYQDRLSPYHPLALSAAREENDSSNSRPDRCDTPPDAPSGSPRWFVCPRQRPGNLRDFVLGDGVIGDD